MTIDFHAEKNPDKPAVIMGGTGERVGYAELVSRSRRLARHMRGLGLKWGDRFAVLMENSRYCFEAAWGAQRSGLYYVPINWHLQRAEAEYILRDCGAKLIFASNAMTEFATSVADTLPNSTARIMVGGAPPNWRDYDDIMRTTSDAPLDGEKEGNFMLYSSGTTGKPKGIRRPLIDQPYGTGGLWNNKYQEWYGIGSDTVYLSPAPLYHAAPIGWSTMVQRNGGTVVVMEKFDPLQMLELIERYRVTHMQVVPTMFVRLLRLPEADRKRFDLSSLRVVVHAAAPCPVEVKDKMIEWLGPIIYEYYAASEAHGLTLIRSPEWLAHRGSVGRPEVGKLHIVDENGEDLPPRETGVVYFEGGNGFEYHNDPKKTQEAYNDKGWATVGDMGYVDEEGYLYLTDRISHMIISGGVNIYPAEIESTLTLHPALVDVAVIGVPNAEYGEEVKAVVIPADPSKAGPALEAELIAYCRERIAHYKCPRSVDFVSELPRLPTGKLLKRELRKKYWPA